MPSAWVAVGCSICFALAVGPLQVDVQPSVLVPKLLFLICGQNKRVISSGLEKRLSSKLKIEGNYF